VLRFKSCIFLPAVFCSNLLWAQDVVVTTAPVLRQHIIKQTEPITPPAAQAEKLWGLVQLRIQVGTDGFVKSAEIIKGPVPLRAAAVDCVKHWTFRPFMRGNTAVSAEGPVDVLFDPVKENLDIHPKSFYHTVKVPEAVSRKLIEKRVQPRYPEIAAAARIHGVVKLQFTVTPSGDTDNVEAISGEPLLQDSAINAVRQWKYRPYVVNGKPTAMETTGEVIFTLQ
jgi:TonB family protein